LSNYSISTNEAPTAKELSELFKQTTWAKNRSISDIDSLIKQSNVFVTIKIDGLLIGYGRALSDGMYRALIDDIVIDESYRKKGLGKTIMTKLLEQLKEVDEVFLNTREHLESFYEQFGFERPNTITMKREQ